MATSKKLKPEEAICKALGVDPDSYAWEARK